MFINQSEIVCQKVYLNRFGMKGSQQSYPWAKWEQIGTPEFNGIKRN